MAERRNSEQGYAVRRATGEDESAVLSVLDGANLATDAAALREAIARVSVLVAASDRSTILGALVLDDGEITHVAVRPGRRGQGIGTALVTAAAEEHDTLTARFDADVRPFYEALGFDIEPAADEGRLVGRRSATD